ncbi:hypothetical protein R3X27_10330 [Tropicimonas sp. TH_r6]|uniref:hypothetical protein n=1 Tax=Tropicimonas sp. TH_r6 TaxID=3082085 RepID=UPI0029556293|nr:hypothetical protein [Tropicimonas sp. TH_r6]MDV7143079.1 hypothetical protein [Tropicimonas sp. TH_r6]
MARASAWALAGTASLALHAAGLAGLVLSVRPDEITQQEPPPTAVVLDAEPVRRARAEAEAPDATRANDQPTDGLALDQDAPRRTRADASAPSSAQLTPQSPLAQAAAPGVANALSLAEQAPAGKSQAAVSAKGAQAPAQAMPARPSAVTSPADTVAVAAQSFAQGNVPETRPTAAKALSNDPKVEPTAALDDTAHRLAETTPVPLSGAALPTGGAAAVPARPTAQALLAQAEQPTPSEPQQPRTMPASTRRPSATPVTTDQSRPIPVRFEPPSAAPVSPVAASPQKAQGSAPPSAALPDLAPSGATVAASAADTPAATETDASETAPRLTAALAWQAGAESEADPISMSAIQAFMQPEALAQGEGKQLRDGLAALLTDIPCARVQTEFRPETGTLELRGHIPEDGLRGPLLAALQAQMGSSIRVADEMRLLPAPQCGALAGIAAVGLPQSDDQRTNPRVIGENTHVRAYAFREGDPLELELVTPDYEAVVYIDYFDAAGNVIHLQPNETVPLRQEPPASRLTSGIERSDRPFLRSFIAPPFAQEIVVAFAGSEPLYEGLRPIMEPAAPYLAFLTERVTEARAQSPDFKGEWVYFFVETGPK